MLKSFISGGFALFFASAFLAAVDLRAQTLDNVLFEKRGWSGTYNSGSDGRYNGCNAVTTLSLPSVLGFQQKSSMMLGISLDLKGSWVAAFTSTDGGFKKKRRYDMTLYVDGREIHRGTANTETNGVALLSPELSPTAVASLKDGEVLEIETDVARQRYSLSGSSDAIAWTSQCVNTLVASMRGGFNQNMTTGSLASNQNGRTSVACLVTDPTGGGELNVRDRPYGPILGRVKSGDTVYRLLPVEAEFDKNGRSWEVVFHARGKALEPLGYVFSDYIDCVSGQRDAKLAEVAGQIRSALDELQRTDPKARALMPVIEAVLVELIRTRPGLTIAQYVQASYEQAQRSASKAPASKVASGTGFFVSHDGYVLTNAHVIEGCSSVVVSQPGFRVAQANVVAQDKRSDLALLKADWRPDHVATLALGVKIGEPVATYGFPHIGMLATTGNFTLGNVTATSGLGDDVSGLQISVPVQSGNSGGPLVDHSGRVVGVIVSKLNVLAMYKESGDLPQNVNFAIKAAIAQVFMDVHGIKMVAQTANELPLKPTDLAEMARKMTVLILCKS